MLMAFFMFTTKKTLVYIINIYSKISKKLDNVYDDFND